MIIDTSALVAVVWREEGHADLLSVLADETGLVPTPVIVEFERVVAGTRRDASVDAEAFIRKLLERNTKLLPFSADHAHAAAQANARHGIGNGRGGTLNLLDLMVYACARVERRPILCTGRDFTATDAAIHPASRTG